MYGRLSVRHELAKRQIKKLREDLQTERVLASMAVPRVGKPFTRRKKGSTIKPTPWQLSQKTPKFHRDNCSVEGKGKEEEKPFAVDELGSVTGFSSNF